MSVYDRIMAGDNGMLGFLLLIVLVVVIEVWNCRRYYARRLHKLIFTKKLQVKSEVRFYKSVFHHKKLIKQILDFLD